MTTRKTARKRQGADAPFTGFQRDQLYFVPLGGAGEIGMNMNLFHMDGKWVIVDLGITFHDRLGVEIVTPDPSFAESIRKDLLGIVATHAHEDHIGAIPWLWERLRCPVYATPFTMELVKSKLKEAGLAGRVPLHVVPLESTLELGPFRMEFISITHSVPEPNMVAIHTAKGTLVHTGDWKLDSAPVVGEPFSLGRLEDLGQKGVLAMLCDSTNVFEKGSSGTEQSVQEGLTECIRQYPDVRVVVACFASNVARMVSTAEAARQTGRQLVLAGRSLHRMDQAARTTGWMHNLPPFLDASEGMALPRNEALFMCTGSQGERRAALYRIATGSHPFLFLEEGDVVIFSSRVIPGNEKEIAHLKNLLVERGIRIVTTRDAAVHVSGHPCQDELEAVYKAVRPSIALPVHGELRHMTRQAELALSWGVRQAVVPRNGDVIRLDENGAEKVGKVRAGQWAADGRTMVPLYGEVLGQRHRMSTDGSVFVSVLVSAAGKATARVSTAGLVGEDDPHAKDVLNKGMAEAVRKALAGLKPLRSQKEGTIRERLEHTVKTHFKATRDKRPTVHVHCVLE
jgi:ribonuclease J